MAGSPPYPVVTPAPSPRGRPPASARLTPLPPAGPAHLTGCDCPAAGADAPDRQAVQGLPWSAPQYLAWRLFKAETSLKGHRPQAGYVTTGVPSGIHFESPHHKHHRPFWADSLCVGPSMGLQPSQPLLALRVPFWKETQVSQPKPSDAWPPGLLQHSWSLP